MGLFSGGYTEEQMLELKAQIKALRDSVTLNEQKYEQSEQLRQQVLNEKQALDDQVKSLQQSVQQLEQQLAQHPQTDHVPTESQPSPGVVELQVQVQTLTQQLQQSRKAEHEHAETIRQLRVQLESATHSHASTSAAQPTTEPPVSAQAIDGALKQLQSLQKSYDLIAQRDELMHAMHRELDALRNGLYAKMLKPYKQSFITLYDSIARTHAYYSQLEASQTGSFAEQYSKLLNQIGAYMQLIVNTLSDEYDVDSYQPEPGQPFVRGQHKVSEVVATTDPTLDYTIVRIHQRGFKYTAFDPVKGVERDVVLRPALVDVYRVSAPQQTTNH